MGFNTNIMILNDRLHDIERDPDFGKKVVDAVCANTLTPSYQPTEFDYQSQVLAQHHADATSIVATGGNTGFVVGFVTGRLYNRENDQRDSANPYDMVDNLKDGWDRELLLRQLADQLGYSLRRKPQSKR